MSPVAPIPRRSSSVPAFPGRAALVIALAACLAGCAALPEPGDSLDRHGPGLGSLPFVIPLKDSEMTALPPAVQCAPGTASGQLPDPGLPAEAVTIPVAPQPAVAAVTMPSYGTPGAPAISNGPLLALGAYIEHSGTCAPDLVEWNRYSLDKVLAGEMPRGFYYRILGQREWGSCDKDSFATLFDQLQEIAHAHAQGQSSEDEVERREAELINLFFASLHESAGSGQAAPADTRQPDPGARPAALSPGPLQALEAYIELSGACATELIEWNRVYGKKVLSGETPRDFYYRVLAYQGGGQCGAPFFVSIFSELQKISEILSQGLISEAEFEAKEAELVNLFFAAVKDRKQGEQLVLAYEKATTQRLIRLDEPRQYSNCTFFGESPRCRE